VQAGRSVPVRAAATTAPLGIAAPTADGHAAINDCWKMDCVSDQLYDGRKLRALTLVDAHA